jgi:hypothetical protein
LDHKSEEKIKQEIIQLNKHFLLHKPLLDLCNSNALEYIKTSAIGSFLHSFYNGIENTLLLIYKGIPENIPNDTNWHRTLLNKSFESTEERPPIFKNEYKKDLEEFMSFRHVFRHSYDFQLELDRLMPLMNKAETLWKDLEKDFVNFIDTL